MASRRESFGGFGGGPGGRFTTNNRFARLFQEGAGDPNDIKGKTQGLAHILNSGLQGFFLGKDRDERDAADAAIAAAFKPDEAPLVTTDTVSAEDEEILDDGVSDFKPEITSKTEADPNFKGRSLSQRLLDEFAENPKNEFLQMAGRRLLPGLIANEQALTAAGVARTNQLTDAETKFGRDKELAIEKRKLGLRDKLEELGLRDRFARGRDKANQEAARSLVFEKEGVSLPGAAQAAGSSVTPGLTPSPPPSAGVAALTQPRQPVAQAPGSAPLTLPQARIANKAAEATAVQTAKSDVKAKAALKKARPKVVGALSTLKRQVKTLIGTTDKKGNSSPGTIDEAIKLIQDNDGFFNSVTGLAGQTTSFIGGTDAFALEALLDTIKANVGFDTLQNMRANSPTGGALGQVSNIEINLLQSVQGSLKNGLPANDLIRNLQKIKRLYTELLVEREAAFKTDFGGGSSAIPNDLVPVQLQ